MNSTRFGSFAICRTAHTHRMIDKCALTELYNHFFARAHSLSKRKQNALKLILGSCWILLFYCIRTDSNFADNRSLRLHRENETEKLLKLSLDSCAVQNTLYSSCHLTNIHVFTLCVDLCGAWSREAVNRQGVRYLCHMDCNRRRNYMLEHRTDSFACTTNLRVFSCCFFVCPMHALECVKHFTQHSRGFFVSSKIKYRRDIAKISENT